MDNINLNDEYLEKLKNGETIVIPLHEERVRVRKEKRVVEEIVIRREKYIEMQKIRVPIRKEIVTVDDSKLNYEDID
ncbi:YsnF/AvaK domain-containing protein [Anaerococcus sp. Marseille-Q5996]|uniref:YsnF/AvaK domain-containing protein n=1 Tax=Anaerococcus martiniensis TaxID=3115615 RepID=A0ABW9M886_9FIRM|nr:YsnF/AvaK domain-containing protein [Anaerococcus sp. Marseille-Q5996]